MRRRWSIDDFDFELRRLMEVVELLQRSVSLGARVFLGEIFVERIVEDFLARRG